MQRGAGPHPVITLADPVIRFNQLITLPQAASVEQGFAEQIWQASAPTFHSKILGPHFEDLARDWTRRFAHTVLPDGLPGPVGTAEVADPAARTKHEVDVMALALGERPQSPRARIALLGEAKATAARRGPVIWSGWNISARCWPNRATTQGGPHSPSTRCTVSIPTS